MAANPYKLTVSQIRDRRRSVRHNVRGIKGLAVEVEGATETIRALAMLPAAVQRRVLRQALAAAARPVLSAMKTGAIAYEKGSTESIGTVARSLGVKVATSKKNPAIAYAMVGARRGFAEIVTLDDRGAITSMRRRQFRGPKKGGVQKLKSNAVKNMGATARKARLDPRNGRIQRRTATRYLHLIERGPRGRIKRAGGFMDKAAISASSSSMQKFDEKFQAGLHREFQKMAAK